MCIGRGGAGCGHLRTLAASGSQRTLRIRLPGATEADNHLAAALARVPWEMARAAADQATLGERNLLVRVVHDMAAPATQPLALSAGTSACACCSSSPRRGGRARWRRGWSEAELLRLFAQEIYPQRRIVADFLTHGVTPASAGADPGKWRTSSSTGAGTGT